MKRTPTPTSVTLAERLSRVHVLLVISSTKAANLIQRMFQQMGFTYVYIANDAVEAITTLKQVRMHLLVADSELKLTADESASTEANQNALAFSGINFIQRLRRANSSPAPFIPVLMLMDQASTTEVSTALNSGVNEIVLKPLDARDFWGRIVHIVDHPRPYVTAPTYRGPCRRRQNLPLPVGMKERRTHDIRLIRYDDKGS